ncbi:hypothetical protein [Psychrobacter jeotgali]|uniref:hypothetical protein n=1 Tax=Psychrobacter jeotgali TaxID=179010 RepID=UPI001919EA07|nr:hypothetical protein [Psychrobacter jeotgali]
MSINHAVIRSLILTISLSSSFAVQAATYQTYVIDTYGGDSLLPAVRQQLNTSPNGGTVTPYQGKLILQTTAANYQAVQKLLTQIDTQPQALTIAVRVGNVSQTQSNIQQGRVVISNHGIRGAGVINQSHNQQHSNNLYQVQTLSGSAASISTGTLYALRQSYQANIYPNYNRPTGQIIIQQQRLLPTTQGIKVTPRLLPNGQVEVQLNQVEEALVNANSSYQQKPTVQAQRLNSTITVPRGQWITIGEIAQSSQNQSSNYGSNRSGVSSNRAPISLLVK